MKVGEIWKLKESHNQLPEDQIHIDYKDEFEHYHLVPALQIISIDWDENTPWGKEYLISYRKIFGLNYDKPYTLEKFSIYGRSVMHSSCLLRNYFKLADSINNLK